MADWGDKGMSCSPHVLQEHSHVYRTLLAMHVEIEPQPKGCQRFLAVIFACWQNCRAVEVSKKNSVRCGAKFKAATSATGCHRDHGRNFTASRIGKVALALFELTLSWPRWLHLTPARGCSQMVGAKCGLLFCEPGEYCHVLWCRWLGQISHDVSHNSLELAIFA